MRISAIGYALVLIAFMLPFFVVSCQQTELFSVTGLKLLTGGEAEFSMGDMVPDEVKVANPNNENKKIPPQPMAMAVAIIAVIAFILVLFLPRSAFYVPIALSVAGFICLFVLKSGILKAVTSSDMGMKEGVDISKVFLIKTKIGFWLANLGFLASLVIVLVDKFFLPSASYQMPSQSNFRHVTQAPSYKPEEEPMPFKDYEPLKHIDDITPQDNNDD